MNFLFPKFLNFYCSISFLRLSFVCRQSHNRKSKLETDRKRFYENAGIIQNRKSRTVNGIYSPGCLYVPVTAVICTFISIRIIRTFSISAVLNTTKAAKSGTSTHCIRMDFLEPIVVAEIRSDAVYM